MSLRNSDRRLHTRAPAARVLSFLLGSLVSPSLVRKSLSFRDKASHWLDLPLRLFVLPQAVA